MSFEPLVGDRCCKASEEFWPQPASTGRHFRFHWLDFYLLYLECVKEQKSGR